MGSSLASMERPVFIEDEENTHGVELKLSETLSIFWDPHSDYFQYAIKKSSPEETFLRDYTDFKRRFGLKHNIRELVISKNQEIYNKLTNLTPTIAIEENALKHIEEAQINTEFSDFNPPITYPPISQPPLEEGVSPQIEGIEEGERTPQQCELSDSEEENAIIVSKDMITFFEYIKEKRTNAELCLKKIERLCQEPSNTLAIQTARITEILNKSEDISPFFTSVQQLCNLLEEEENSNGYNENTKRKELVATVKTHLNQLFLQ